MKHKMITFVLSICIFIVYLFGQTALLNYLISFPSDGVVLFVTILVILISLVLTVVTIRRVAYVYMNNKPDKQRVHLIVIVVLLIIYLFGMQSIFESVLPLEHPAVNIVASIVWFALSIGLAILTRRKIEEWYRST